LVSRCPTGPLIFTKKTFTDRIALQLLDYSAIWGGRKENRAKSYSRNSEVRKSFVRLSQAWAKPALSAKFAPGL
jgi:hypothetical protein